MRKIVGFFIGLFLMVGISAYAAEAPVKVSLSPAHSLRGLVLAQKTATLATPQKDHTGPLGKEVARLVREHPCIRLRDRSSAKKHIALEIFVASDDTAQTLTLTVTTNPRSCF